jgi:hypothetical protein
MKWSSLGSRAFILPMRKVVGLGQQRHLPYISLIPHRL